MAEKINLPVGRQIIDPNTGMLRVDWERFLKALAAAINKLNGF